MVCGVSSKSTTGVLIHGCVQNHFLFMLTHLSPNGKYKDIKKKKSGTNPNSRDFMLAGGQGPKVISPIMVGIAHFVFIEYLFKPLQQIGVLNQRRFLGCS